MKNKFVLDFSQKELVYRIRFSIEKDYYITSMKCNVIIHDDYEHVSHEIKQLSKKVIYYEKEKGQDHFLKIVEENPKFYNFGQFQRKGNQCRIRSIRKTLEIIYININFLMEKLVPLKVVKFLSIFTIFTYRI